MTKKNFCQDWSFTRGEIPGAHAGEFDDEGWERVGLPHCFNAEDTFTATRGYYRGPAWYRKRFLLSEHESRGAPSLEFGAGFAVARVWVNGETVGEFMGGFTGFSVPLAHRVRDGWNVVAIRVDNTHNPDVLPGKEVPDYNLYGGLYREAYLVTAGLLHIERHGLRIDTPQVSRQVALVRVSVVVENDDVVRREGDVRGKIIAPNGTLYELSARDWSCEAGSQVTVTFDEVAVARPSLWSPLLPSLYGAHIWLTESSKRGDSAVGHFGIRFFTFDADVGLILNGGRLKLRGVNRHQDYPGLGNAVPMRLQVRDAEILKEMGANFVRTSHYPQHPAFLDACDRLGIIVNEEIASWQFIGGEAFVSNAEQMLREMIARDRNHPSIFLWGLLNEGRSRELFERLHRCAQECDPSRPTIYAENRPDEGIELGTVGVPSVLGINYKLPHMDEIRAKLPGIPLLSCEHTNADQSVRGNLEAELIQVERLITDTQTIESRPYLAGGALWSMHDYGTDYEPVWPCQHSGILDAYRVPKLGYYYLKSRWSEEPVVHICTHWTWPSQEGQLCSIITVSNCETVELFLNGESLGIRSGEKAMRWEAAYEQGILEAVGKRGHVEVRDVRYTAYRDYGLRLGASPQTIHADGSDVCELTVEIIDAKGVVVPTSRREVRFSVLGPATVRGIGGSATTRTMAGIGRIAIQAGTTPGPVTVHATALELVGAAVMIQVI